VLAMVFSAEYLVACGFLELTACNLMVVLEEVPCVLDLFSAPRECGGASASTLLSSPPTLHSLLLAT
jgi:hypothetical protein